jgi:hypothetical protein
MNEITGGCVCLLPSKEGACIACRPYWIWLSGFGGESCFTGLSEVKPVASEGIPYTSHACVVRLSLHQARGLPLNFFNPS